MKRGSCDHAEPIAKPTSFSNASKQASSPDASAKGKKLLTFWCPVSDCDLGSPDMM